MTPQQITNLKSLPYTEMPLIKSLALSAAQYAEDGNQGRYDQCVAMIESFIGKPDSEASPGAYSELYHEVWRAYWYKINNTNP